MPILFLTVVIDLIGFGIVIPILPFVTPAFGGDEVDIALLIAGHSIFAGLCGPLWGRFSDHFGRKPALLLCLLGAMFSYVLLAFAETLAMVYAARFFAGAMSGNFGVAAAMVADMTPPEQRAKSMGIIGASFGLGLVLGPVLGGLLAGDAKNFFLPAMVAAALSLTAFLAGLFLLKESLTPALKAQQQKAQAESVHQGESLYQLIKRTGNRLLIFQYLVHNSTHSMVSYLFPLWVGVFLGWGPQQVGWVFAAQGLVMAILQGTQIGRLVDALGERGVLLMGVCLMTLGFAAAAIAEGPVMIVAACFFIITGATICTPVMNALVSNRTPLPDRGRMMGTTSAMSAWGRMFGPLWAGGLLALFGYHWAWAGGLLLCVWTAWFIRQVLGPKLEKPATPS